MSSSRENGVNMLDVKKSNRASILQVVYRFGNISRKDISLRLGLTPAAITMITGEMLSEGLLIETGTEKNQNRKGRREMLLQIDGNNFAALGVNITRHKFRILCIDLNNNIIFEDTVYTFNCHRKANFILEKVVESINSLLEKYNILETKKIVGLGVSINGIVNSIKGISVNAFQVWDEKNINVASILYEKLGISVLLTNNICALTHAESILAKENQKNQMLFIKYGPGLGATHSLRDGISSVFNYRAIELGHVISEPNGAPCVCGNRGCIETIINYDSIENTLQGLVSERDTPMLWKLLNGDTSKILMQDIIQAYDAGDKVVTQIFERVIYYLSLAIKDAGTLFDPENIVLYGELFENDKFRKGLRQQLSCYTNTEKVSFSHYNMELETMGPATTVISLFFENGGVLNNV